MKRPSIPTAKQILQTEGAAQTTLTPERWAQQAGLDLGWVRAVFARIRQGNAA